MTLLRSVRMVHFRVQLPSRDAAAATRAIAREGLLHLVDIGHGRSAQEGVAPELYAAFRDLRNRARSVAERLEIPIEEVEGALQTQEGEDFEGDRARISATLEPVERRVDELWRAISSAREKKASLRDQLAHAERLSAAGVDLRRIADVRFAIVRFAIAPAESVQTLASLLSPAPFAISTLDRQEPPLVAMAVPPFAKSRLEEALRVASMQVIRFTGGEAASPERLRLDLAAGEKGEKEALAALAAARQELAPLITSIAQRLEVTTLLLQAQTYFATSGRFVVISGWLPEESAAKMKEAIRAATHDRAIIDVERAEDVAGVVEGTIRVPILHRNPILLRPFQRLVEIYGTPSYSEVQPTAFFGISFLLMFGLMFGDVGHGLILFIAGWCLFRFLPQWLDYGILLMEAGSASAAFGFLYGSIFGIEGLLPSIWLRPLEDLSRFMIIAVAVGVVIVSAGLTLNIVNTWRSGNVREALYGPRGLTGALLYWVVLVVLARMFVPSSYEIPAGLIFILAGIALAVLIGGRWIARRFETRRAAPHVHTGPRWLTLLESAIELVDTMFSFFANTISFVRVAAFAAVHAGIFIAIFTIADTLARVRLGGVLSILVHVAGNALVILLEGLTVSVQVLRLEYYEFFGKFFRGGGEPYLPLMLRHEPKQEELKKRHA
jgi:V/A-type H+-transporting ATPase subunit I